MIRAEAHTVKDEEKHESVPFFEHRRAPEALPAAATGVIEVALLETAAHPSPACVAMAATVESAAAALALESSGFSLRLTSFDTSRGELPEPGRFRLYLAAGEPATTGADAGRPEEARIARVLDAVAGDDSEAMLVTGDLFDAVCRWAGIGEARPRSDRLRGPSVTRLSREALQHPWFRQFAHELPDQQHFLALDDRITDMVLGDPGKTIPVAFEASGVSALTMLEIARDRDGVMPRFLAMTHQPQLTPSSSERREKSTAQYTLIEPLQFHLRRLVSRLRS